ncbi:MAG: prepilin peptidase [Vulcanimicrobiaceae bacterium]
MTSFVLAYAAVGAACTIAVATDLRTRRVPNGLTGGLALAALPLAFVGGLSHLAASLGVAVAVFALGMLAFGSGLLGGGDVKLLAAAALALGYPLALGFVMYTLISGGALALAWLLVRGRVGEASVRLKAALLGGGRAAIGLGSGRLPYAVAIAAGAGCSALSTFVFPAMRILS